MLDVFAYETRRYFFKIMLLRMEDQSFHEELKILNKLGNHYTG